MKLYIQDFFQFLQISFFLVLFVSSYIIRTIAYWLEDKWLIFNAILTIISILLCLSVMIRNFQVGQWLGLRAVTAEGLSSIPVKGTKISLALWSKKPNTTMGDFQSGPVFRNPPADETSRVVLCLWIHLQMQETCSFPGLGGFHMLWGN